MISRGRHSPHRAGLRWACLLAALAAAGLWLAFAPGTAVAATFNVNPTRVELDRQRSTGTLTVTNASTSALAFEVVVKRWAQRADGSWQLEPSDDLVVHPLIVSVPAQGAARLRVGALSPTVASEQAYRIELQQLPEGAATQGVQILMLTRVSIPVFVQPPQTRRHATLEAATLETAGSGGCVVRLSLRNTGSTYLAPQEAVLRLLDGTGQPLHEETIASGYVLAGAALPVARPVPAAACAGSKTVELRLRDPSVVLSATIATATP